MNMHKGIHEVTDRMIKLENVGPIESLSIEAPEGGGVLVLRGRNGSGKTQTLGAIDAALGASAKGLTVHDGELAGSVEALGVRLTLGRQNRRTGSLVVDTLEGRLRVDQVVDPGLIDQAAADGRRIKALVNLVGAEADAAKFRPLLGDLWGQVVKADHETLGDLVAMAEAIKRDCEAAARQIEGEADQAEAQAHAAIQSLAGVDLDIETDGDKLQTELERQVAEQAALRQRQADQLEAEQKHEAAMRRLEGLPDTAEAVKAKRQMLTASESTLQLLQADADKQAEEIATLQAEAQRLAADIDRQAEAVAAARQAVTAAEEADQAAAAARDIIGQTLPAAVEPQQIADAEQAITKARQAIEAATLARQAIQKKGQAEEKLQHSQQLRAKSENLRNAGRGTDDVLSEVVGRASAVLMVDGGRLVSTTSRGKVYFCDLSMGERWRIAIDLAIDAVGPGGLFTIRQEAWEGLDPQNRAAIAEHVKGREVVVLTAEATADEQVQAVEYQPTPTESN